MSPLPLHTISHWFWAKLGQHSWPEAYHPVICHLFDAGNVARELWTNCLRPRAKQAVSDQLGLSADDAGAWIAFWIAAHDIGKITPCFQFRDNSSVLKKKLTAIGFNSPGDSDHHTATGTKILHDALTASGWPGFPRPVAQKVAVAVGGHHGTFPTNGDSKPDLLGNERWAGARHIVLADLARSFGVSELPAPCPPATGDQSVWMLLAGLAAVADWIGSNVNFFEPAGNATVAATDRFDLDAYFDRSGKQAVVALDSLGWLGRAEPTERPRGFTAATGIKEPRPLQDAIIPLAQGMSTPQLFVIEAPMGEGKTEAAWYVADCWDRHGGAGTYVALPTMATSNQMFERVKKFLDLAGGGHLMLLHGKAALNKQFDKLKYAARVYDPDGSTSGVVAESWFADNKKHRLLAPFGVGTIDQVLLSVLQTKHGFVRLFGLAGKCVILDEVHAYDAYMTTLLERLLRWLAALGCPVVLLSATLPKEKRERLLQAYAGTQEWESPEEIPYPRVTTLEVGDKKPVAIHVAADPARRKTVRLRWLDEGALVARLKESLSDGGCAAVIRNTVGLAQKTFLLLKEAFVGTEVAVELFHARFPFGRRQQIEMDVLDQYGKGKDGTPANQQRPTKAILVATQVIEQSLDLDFDAMYTDVAPVDLVLQRAGRLHRHERGERGNPCLWLIKPTEKDGKPDFGPSEWVYPRFVLLRSLVALRAKEGGVILPDDLEPLVEQVYGKHPLVVPAGYSADLAASEKAMREEQRLMSRNAKSVMIWNPDTSDLLNQPNLQLVEDDPEAHRKVQAATRDTEPTVQLVLVYHLDGQDFLDPDGKEPFDEDDVPNVACVRRLLLNEVTISHTGCVFHYVTHPVPQGWKKNGMLRHHRLLRADGKGASVTDDFIRLDHDLGIVISRKKETGGAE